MTNSQIQELTHYAIQEPIERFYNVDAYLVGSEATREICLVTNEGYDIEIVGVDLKGNRVEDFENWQADIHHAMQSTKHLRHLINQPLNLI